MYLAGQSVDYWNSSVFCQVSEVLISLHPRGNAPAYWTPEGVWNFADFVAYISKANQPHILEVTELKSTKDVIVAIKETLI